MANLKWEVSKNVLKGTTKFVFLSCKLVDFSWVHRSFEYFFLYYAINNFLLFLFFPKKKLQLPMVQRRRTRRIRPSKDNPWVGYERVVHGSAKGKRWQLTPSDAQAKPKVKTPHRTYFDSLRQKKTTLARNELHEFIFLSFKFQERLYSFYIYIRIHIYKKLLIS